MDAFVFGEVPSYADTITANVPSKIDSKAELLEVLYRVLKFPEYFGSNWDALEECLRDLSWLPPGAIVIVHGDIPLRGDSGSFGTYLSILKGAAEQLNSAANHRLIAVFPQECREDVLLALDAIQDQ